MKIENVILNIHGSVRLLLQAVICITKPYYTASPFISSIFNYRLLNRMVVIHSG